MKDNISRINFNEIQYGRIAMQAANDKRISGNAFHFLFKCLNNREGWKIRVEVIADQLGWKEDKRKNAIKTLIQCGYMKQERVQLPSGKLEWVYTVSEAGDLLENKPVQPTPQPSPDETIMGKPHHGEDELEEDDEPLPTTLWDEINNHKPSGKYETPMTVLKAHILNRYSKFNPIQRNIISGCMQKNSFEQLYQYMKVNQLIPPDVMKELTPMIMAAANT